MPASQYVLTNVDVLGTAASLNVISSNALTTTNIFANTLTLANAASSINVIGSVTASTFYGAIAGSNTVSASTLTGDGSGITSLNMGNAGSGTLAVASGGTGVTSSTGTGSVVLSSGPTLDGTTTIETLNLTNALAIANGGTGLTSFTSSGGLLYTTSTSTLASSAIYTAGQILYGSGPGAAPSSSSGLFWDTTNSRLGIGKTNPGTALDVNGTVTATTFSGSFSGSGALLTSLPMGQASGTLAIANGGTGLTSFTSSGGLLYTTSTSTLASSAIYTAGQILYGSGPGAAPSSSSGLFWDTTNSRLGIGLTGPSYQLDLSTDGARKLTSTTWLTGSDQRIKTDIESANLQMCYDTVKSIDLKYFKWNFPTDSNVVPDDKHSLGFIAQEIQKVFPNAVSESNSYGYTDFLSLNTDQILKAMYGALKQTMADKEALEQRLAALESKLAA